MPWNPSCAIMGDLNIRFSVGVRAISNDACAVNPAVNSEGRGLSCAVGISVLFGGLAGGAVRTRLGSSPRFSAGAYAATATKVVPNGGKVAGHGYGYWQQRAWQLMFSSPGPMSPCGTVTSNGQRVAILREATLAPGTYSYTCSEPAGRPLYVREASDECSTFTGDHGSFGTSNQQLTSCAQGVFQGAKESVTVDRQPVGLATLVTATGVFPVDATTNNIFGFSPGSGRSAAYGSALLLTHLAKGTHHISTLISAFGGAWHLSFTVHVH